MVCVCVMVCVYVMVHVTVMRKSGHFHVEADKLLLHCVVVWVLSLGTNLGRFVLNLCADLPGFTCWPNKMFTVVAIDSCTKEQYYLTLDQKYRFKSQLLLHRKVLSLPLFPWETG